MQYSNEYLREFLPPEDPPQELVPPDVEGELRSRVVGPGDEDRGLVARSTRWTYAMFNELRLGQVVVEGDFRWGLMQLGALGLTIGLYDTETEQGGFGLALLTSVSKGPEFELIASVGFPRLNRRFPLAARQAALDEHAPPHPSGATSAAWAKCNGSATLGVLTAGHAVPGTVPGQAVTFANGQIGSLSLTAYPVIDAAFVSVPGMPTGATPMSILRFPASGHKAVVERQAGPATRTVVGTHNSLGTNNTRVYRVMFLTDTPCTPGDSGALVRSPQGEAMGIYSGSLKTPAVPSGLAGFNQNFEQATLALNVTAYS